MKSMRESITLKNLVSVDIFLIFAAKIAAQKITKFDGVFFPLVEIAAFDILAPIKVFGVLCLSVEDSFAFETF